MPRLKPPPSQETELEIDDLTPPEGPVEIKLDEPDDGSVQIDLKPQNVKPTVKPNIGRDPADGEEEDPLKQQQTEADKRAEELQRQLADLHRKQAESQRQLDQARREREQERGEREQAQFDAVLTAIAAEQAALQKARSDYAIAASSGDWNAAADAQQLMAQAAARVDRLEDGKRAFETKREEKKEPPPERAAPNERQRSLDDMVRDLPPQAQEWLRAHPQFMTDPAQNAKIQSYHSYITNNRGVAAWSPEYFEALDEEFGFKKKQATESEATHSTNNPPRRSIPVSAPVSRETPNSSGVRNDGSVTLTKAEREVARTSFGPVKDSKTGVLKDLTNAQKERLYAENKARLRRERANGTYDRYSSEETG